MLKRSNEASELTGIEIIDSTWHQHRIWNTKSVFCKQCLNKLFSTRVNIIRLCRLKGRKVENGLGFVGKDMYFQDKCVVLLFELLRI